MGIQTINFFDIFFSVVKVKEEKGNDGIICPCI